MLMNQKTVTRIIHNIVYNKSVTGSSRTKTEEIDYNNVRIDKTVTDK